MNINTLHHYLTKLSESELRYQTGESFDSWNMLPIETFNNRKVYRMFNDNNLFPEILNLSSDTENFSNAVMQNGNLSIKRNSRFNPVPEHVHSHIELNYVYSGKCPQMIDGKRITLEKDQVLLIDTDCPHSIDALGENDIMISIIIKKEFLKDHLFSQFSRDSILSHFFINAINEKTDHDHYLLFHSENNRRIPIFFQELFCECFDPSINSKDIITHLFYVIMAELINVYENELANDKDFFSTTPIIPMLRYIENNFRTCTQESMADFFHISPNYVTTMLKKHTGMSYIQLIQAQKLQYAASLLKSTPYSVTEIAREAGYENMHFFYKKFEERYHCSPKEYRTSN